MQPDLVLILEGALLAAHEPLSVERLQQLFVESEDPLAALPTPQEIKMALNDLESLYAQRAIALKQVASGYRFQVRQSLAPWISKLWEEKPARYSRALLETLVLIAYRQPITRAEIEEVRGVAVSTAIVKTLLEREWVRIVGHKDVPGKPALYATTKQFLNYFNLQTLDELPTLAAIQDLTQVGEQMDLLLEEQGLPADESSYAEAVKAELAVIAAAEIAEQAAFIEPIVLDEANGLETQTHNPTEMFVEYDIDTEVVSTAS